MPADKIVLKIDYFKIKFVYLHSIKFQNDLQKSKLK